ncbi:hypothetical protein HML84_07650 [Alcanivorax sp. IO_7]|nr:hypothetical protein HML84_07650 [Alcanivorax sp. IO_7]
MNDASGSPLAGGLLSNVGGSTSTAVACDAGSTVNVPDQVPVTNGVFSYTGATFNAVGLDNKGCTLVP